MAGSSRDRVICGRRDTERKSWIAASIVISAALVIGLVYGSVGLLSGFCLMSGLRGWWAEGDGRLVRTYALAIGVAVAATQLLAAAGFVDIGKSIYLQSSFSAPVMFFGGSACSATAWCCRTAAARARWCCSGAAISALSWWSIVLAIFAQMTLKGLIAPARIAMVGASQTTATANSVPALLAAAGLSATASRACWRPRSSRRRLIIFAFAHPAFRRSPGQIAAGLAVGLLVAAGWFATGYLGADDFNPTPVTSLTFIAPIADALQYVMLSTGSTLNFGIVTVFGVFAGSLVTALADRTRFHLEGFQSPRHMLRSGGGAALMGAGGVMAFGCSIGRGLTGFSTLALASLIAFAGILVGYRRQACAAHCASAAARGGLIRRFRHDPDFRGERPVHRALVGDLHQALALIGVEVRLRSRSRGRSDRSMPFAGFAFGAIFRVDLAVLQRHRDALERQRFAVGIHPHRHRGAGAKAGEHEIIRPGSAVLAAGGERAHPPAFDADLW